MNFLDNILNGFLNANSGSNNAMTTISCSGSSIDLPVMPDSFNISVSNKNGVVSINNDGDYNMIGKTGLKAIAITSFFPAQAYDFCLCTPSAPYDYINKIEVWRKSEKPCQLTISGTSIDITCLIESFSYGEKDGSGDVYFSINFKEYRYIEGISPKKIDGITGLATRPKQSFLEQSLSNFKMYPGDSPLTAISRAMGKIVGAGITVKQAGYLDVYSQIQKGGGLVVGDLIDLTKKSAVKINGRNI